MSQEGKIPKNELKCGGSKTFDEALDDCIAETWGPIQKLISEAPGYLATKKALEYLYSEKECSDKFPPKSKEGNYKKNNRKLGKSEVRLKRLPLLSNCKKDKVDMIFIKKIQLCSTVSNNYSLSCTKSCSEMKTAALEDLSDYICDKGKISSAAYSDIVEMFAANVFRTLPPRRFPFSNEFDSDDEVMSAVETDPQWPCLRMVYHFFLTFLESQQLQVSTLKPFITKGFIISLLSVFESEIPTERDYLKVILHKLYAAYLAIRPLVRKQISYTFQTFIYETGVHNGIAELLDIFVSIIEGFVVPIKVEHKIFLLKTLMPLHKPNSLPTYHVQLIYCVRQYLAKEPSLSEPVLKLLIKYWPKTSSSKEVLFLLEVEEVFLYPEVLSELEKKTDIKILLLKQLAKSASSPHLQVSEKSLEILRGNEIQSLMNEELKADEYFSRFF